MKLLQKRTCICIASVLCGVMAVAQVPKTPEGAKTTTVTTADRTIEHGWLNGVEYRMDVPKGWKNGGLLVYYHGYSERDYHYRDTPKTHQVGEAAIAHGFAVIQSAYSETGWALDRAVNETELLRQLFIAEYGKPSEQVVSGESMGGALTLKTIELEPEIYEGAMDFCGPLQPTYDFMQARTAQLAAFEYYFPGLLPKIGAIPPDYAESPALTAKLKAAVEANPAAQEAMETLSGLKGAADLAAKAAYAVYIVKDYTAKAGGQPFDNRNFVYVGTKDDAALNRGVERYTADPIAAQYLMQYMTPSGVLLRPTIEMHTLYDRLIPAGTDFWYSNQVMRTGHADNFVLQYVERNGHCNFTAAQQMKGLDELLDWVHSGKRPQNGLLDIK